MSRRLVAALAAAACLAGCYPRFDWRDHRPDCARGWCGFVATFPGKVTSATREIPVAGQMLPLSLHVASAGDITFAVGAFDLIAGSDARAARAVFEHKLLDDVGAGDGRRGRTTMRAADRSEFAADTFDVEGRQGGQALRASARFVERGRQLIEIVVIGPAEALDTPTGRQAVETFVTSLRLD